MSGPLVLIADDDPSLREIVRFALEKEGFETAQAADGRAALESFLARPPALVILDITMPEMDGTEVCRRIRRQSDAPIIFLSSRDEELDRVLGLEIGGDDYVTKPFSPRELLARVKAVLRRGAARPGTASDEPAELRWGPFRLDLVGYRAYCGPHEVVLTAMEFSLLRALMTHPQKVFTRDELIDKAYGGETVVSDRTIDSHVRRIRRKLEPAGQDPIETVTGVGYRMAPPDR